jgi:hypothetical protein
MIGRTAEGDSETAPYTPEYNNAYSDLASENNFRILAEYVLYGHQGRTFRRSKPNDEHNPTCIVRLLIVLVHASKARRSELVPRTFCIYEISVVLSSSKDFPRPLFSDKNNATHIPRPTNCATMSWLHAVMQYAVGCFLALTCARMRTKSSRPCAFHFTNPSRTARMQNAKMRDRMDAIQIGAL